MENLFEKISRISKSIRLNEEEKARTRENLIEFMKYHPVRNVENERHIQQRSYIISPFYLFMLKPIPIVALAVVLLLGGISGAAANTLPGDTLYPVKIASESVVTAFAFSPEKKAERNIALAERRLEEAETLMTQGKLTAPFAATLQEKVENYTNAVEVNLNKLTEENKLDKAIRISSNFEVALNAHEIVLGKIAVNFKTPTVTSSEDVTTTFTKLVQEQKDAATKIRVDVESLPAVQVEPMLMKLVEDLSASRAIQGETKVKEVEDKIIIDFPPYERPEVRSAYIQKASPSAGMVGTKITLTGYGFMRLYVRAPDGETGETYVNFGGGYVKASGDSATLTFTVPEGIAPKCAFVVKKDEPICMVAMRKTTPGEYAIKVMTPWGESNAIIFKVIEFIAPDPNPEPTPMPNPMGISVETSTDKRYYNVGDGITITITAKNTTKDLITLRFKDGCQATYAIAFYDGGSKSQSYEDTRICTTVITEVTIAPGASRSWTRVYTGNLSYGQYEITGIVGSYGQASTKIFVYGGNI